MMDREPPWEQNGLHPMVNIMRIAWAKYWNASTAQLHGQLPDY